MEFFYIKRFLKQEAMGGIFLFVAALMALLLCNSPWAAQYEKILIMPVSIFWAQKPLLFWVNEGLMPLFFLLIGLELKREFLTGELSSYAQVILPGVAALGGMVVPGLIYFLFNHHDPIRLQGWAVPVATDIAFALGVLSLMGSRVPLGLRLFLMALAIFDDLGAIVIIAVFHSDALSLTALLLASMCIGILWLLNWRGVRWLSAYLLVGLGLWICVLQSGVHATLAGVVLALMIPLRGTPAPLLVLEKRLDPWVSYFVMPLFAFTNAGLSLTGLSSGAMFDTVVLGVVAGLFLGKQLGVVSFAYVMIKLGFAKLPDSTSWLAFYAVAILCGIGFTMSLFLGTLAFQGDNPTYLIEVRLGVLLGSVLSGVIGALMLQMAFFKTKKAI